MTTCSSIYDLRNSQEVVDWIHREYGLEVPRPGLDRLRVYLNPILPHFKDSQVVTIVGTNGKGETALRLSHLIRDHKSHVLWTSPHVERITERFKTEKGEISLDELKKNIEECHQEVQKMRVSLSFYEFLFYVFCRWAIKLNPQLLLLEVGLGGRLDAVNIFDAKLVLLPSLSRDHQEILGKRLDQILEEKLGVLRQNTIVYHFLDSDYLVEILNDKVCALKGEAIALRDFLKVSDFDFSVRNSFLAYFAFSYLCHGLKVPLLSDVFSSEIRRETLENRGEVLNALGARWCFYGAHNIDGLRKLIQLLKSQSYNRFHKILVSFSQRDDRDLKVMVSMLKKAQLGEVILFSFNHPKSVKQEKMQWLANEEKVNFEKNTEFFMGQIASSTRPSQWNVQPSESFLVVGSYYFVSSIKTILGNKSASV